MAQKLIKLKVERDRIVHSLDRFEKFLDDTPKDTLNYEELKLRLNNVEGTLDEFTRVHYEILAVEPSEENLLDEFEGKYFSLLGRSKTFLKEHDNEHARSNLLNSSNYNNAEFKLPKVDIPKFDGKFDLWVSFYGSFKSLIHENAALARIQKFHYLVSSLKGEAAEVISAFEIRDENYETAWSTVVSTYNNVRKMVQKHIKAIFDLPTTNKECAETLRIIIRGCLKHTRSLTLLGRPANQWDDLLVYLIMLKIDAVSVTEFERSLDKNEFPTLDALAEFINTKCDSLELSSRDPNSNIKRSNANITNAITVNCICCKGQHGLAKCAQFKKLPIDERYQLVQGKGHCINCLKKANHSLATCFGIRCPVCHRKHHSTLHRFGTNDIKMHSGNPIELERAIQTRQTCTADNGNSGILLTTAVVHMLDIAGGRHKCRVLLDNGSQVNLMTESFVKRLNLNCNETSLSINTVNNTQAAATLKTTCELKSRHSSYSKKFDCYIVSKITDHLPSMLLDPTELKIPPKLKLADPLFHKPEAVDALLGAEIFWNILISGRINPGKMLPSLQKTSLGWIVGGIVPEGVSKSNCNLITNFQNANDEFDLQTFWQLEEITEAALGSNTDPCERHFLENVKRNETGRFIVRLPFKGPPSDWGESRYIARKRFFNLEKRLQADSKLREQYSNYINESQKLVHLEESVTFDDFPYYYLSHHPVFKRESVTTKLRIVYDGSCKTSNLVSLNDVLMTGPVVQPDIFTLLIRFRTCRYVLSADIKRMYNQVLIDPQDTRFLKLFWRDDPSHLLKKYELKVLPFGLSPSSYLATRCLNFLADENQAKYPDAAHAIKNFFYVDDLLATSNDLKNLQRMRDEIIHILRSGGFELDKFNANHPSLLNNIPVNDNDRPPILLNKFDSGKVLGLYWTSKNDDMRFSVPTPEDARPTKRNVLAYIARIFDPLGLINPVVVEAKVLIQKLWQAKLDWDEPMPEPLLGMWTQLKNQIPLLSQLTIPRSIVGADCNMRFELFGFADASIRAYGAAIYLRVKISEERYTGQLLCAKSRVAPLKTLTIPRLELCGCLLLARLMDAVTKSLSFAPKRYLFSDSSIVLAWLKMDPSKLKLFVRNRIFEINELSKGNTWAHVKSEDNPADMLSRGAMPSQLLNSSKWFCGPSFMLSNDNPNQHDADVKVDEIPEVIANPQLQMFCLNILNVYGENGAINIFDKYSSFLKLIRVTAYVIRFVQNCKPAENRVTGELSAKEIDGAKVILVRIIQAECFYKEIRALKNKINIEKTSSLRQLNPFLDTNGLLRVGGRLKNSKLSEDEKHPLILPKRHKFNHLLYTHIHKSNMHVGPQATLAIVRQNYWPLAAKNDIKFIIKQCITCFKNRPDGIQPMMGDLPKARVTAAFPFLNCGIDFCGPFFIREGVRKFIKKKAYAAIFVCLSTKCVHVELVSDLTSEAFITAMRRFIARRGKCLNVYTDNGTNFVGANRELRDLVDYFNNDLIRAKLITEFSEEGINWSFIPPKSPHFGGIWERAVRSFKYHLRRVVGETILTFEELNTVLVQAESILNSRPLIPLTNDPDDFECLTPGHFLIGRPIVAIPSQRFHDVKTNRLSRWQLLQKIQQDFWKIWSREYLQLLQGRYRWQRSQGTTLAEGDLVLIKEDNTPPLRWVIGRVQKLYPGADGIARVADVCTSTGTFKRAVVRLCPLPVKNEE